MTGIAGLPGGARIQLSSKQTGNAKRIHKKKVLASKKECPTKKMAQSKLDDLLHGINRELLVLPSDLRTIEVALCDSCRGRLIAALQEDNRPGTP